MFYSISSARDITIGDKKQQQVITVSWRHGALISSNGQLRTAAAVWAGAIDDLDPTGSTHSSVTYSQVMELPDRKDTVSLTSIYGTAVVTVVDLNQNNAPCTFILPSTSTSTIRTDITTKIVKLMNITVPNARVLITTVNIRVKEA